MGDIARLYGLSGKILGSETRLSTLSFFSETPKKLVAKSVRSAILIRNRSCVTQQSRLKSSEKDNMQAS